MSSVRPLPLPPLRTDREANVTSIIKAMLAHARASDMQEALQMAREDRGATAMLDRSYKQRAATTPHSLANTTTFSQSVVDATVDILGLDHIVGAVLSRAGVKATFGRNTSVWVPGVQYDGSKVSWIVPGNPFRIGQFDMSKGCTLNAGLKLGFGIVVSSELLEDSNAEPILRRKVIEDVGGGLEATLFGDSDAVENQQPAGLLHDVQTVTASDLSNPGDALIADLGGLAAAAGGGIGGEIIYAANLAEATRIQARLPFSKNVFASSAISAGNLVAIAPRGLAVAGSDQGPRINTSGEATVVLDDALTDEQVNTSGTIGFPLRSLFQSDTRILRLLLPDLCWAQRVAAGTGGCVAMLTGTIGW